MFRPNLTVQLRRYTGRTLHGAKQYGTPQRVRCGVVWLEAGDEKSSVRTDSSASRGSAREPVMKARLLFKPGVTPAIGDLVEFMGFTMTVQSVFPRHAVDGRFDHWQVDLDPGMPA